MVVWCHLVCGLGSGRRGSTGDGRAKGKGGHWGNHANKSRGLIGGGVGLMDIADAEETHQRVMRTHWWCRVDGSLPMPKSGGVLPPELECS